MPRAPSQHYEMCRKLPARSDYKFKYSTPAPAVRSRRRSIAHDRVDALFVGPDGFFNARRVQFATLATHYRIPAAYATREVVEIGGLMSYGTDLLDMYRQVGVYTGRILKGANPANLPVVQSTKFEFVINLQTARALGLEVPLHLQQLADEVIE